MGTMAMFGAPMAAGFLQRDGPGQTGAGASASYTAGGALTGAASGAMMAAMVAPFLGPAAPFVIAAGALTGAVYGGIKAQEENTAAVLDNIKKAATADASAMNSLIAQALASIAPKVMQGYSSELSQLMQGINRDNIKDKDTIAQAEFLQKMLGDSSVDQDRLIKVGSEEQAKLLGIPSNQGTAKISEVNKAADKIIKDMADIDAHNEELKSDFDGIEKNNARRKILQEGLNDLLKGLESDLKISSQAEGDNVKAVIRRLNLQIATNNIQQKINKNLSIMKIESQRSLSMYSWLEKFGIQGNEIVKNQIKFSKAIDEATLELERGLFSAKESQAIVALQKIDKSSGAAQADIKDFLSNPEKMKDIAGVSDQTLEDIQMMRNMDSDYTQMASILTYEQILQILGEIGKEDNDILQIRNELVENLKREKKNLENIFNEKESTLTLDNRINSLHSSRLEMQKSITREINQQNDFIERQNTQNELARRLEELRFKNSNQFASKQQEILPLRAGSAAIYENGAHVSPPHTAINRCGKESELGAHAAGQPGQLDEGGCPAAQGEVRRPAEESAQEWARGARRGHRRAQAPRRRLDRGRTREPATAAAPRQQGVRLCSRR